MGTKTIFDAGLKQGQEQTSAATVVLLIFCGFLTGNGGSGGASGSLNTVAKSFPEHVVSIRNLLHTSRSCAYLSILTHREPALRRWYYPASDSLPFCSPQSLMPPSLGTHLTSSSSWPSGPHYQWSLDGFSFVQYPFRRLVAEMAFMLHAALPLLGGRTSREVAAVERACYPTMNLTVKRVTSDLQDNMRGL